MAEHWRVGRHVPHHVYRSDGGLVADEVAVTHCWEDAQQIVEDHNRAERLAAALKRIVAYYEQDGDHICICGTSINRMAAEARQALAEGQ